MFGDPLNSDMELGLEPRAGHAGVEAPDDEPPADAVMGGLAEANMAAFFGAHGPIAAALDGYEARASQVAMAQAVQRALLEHKHALIEAPTGTGKSLAYLVPAILSGRQVVVATANKSLQAQLFLKDIPFLAQALGREIDAVIVKGRSNYLCLHKWEEEKHTQRQFARFDRESAQIAGIRRWLDETESGDVDELPFVLESDLRPRLVSFPDDCIGRDCDFFDRCFVETMRNRAAEAQVVITNHHLLLNALELGVAGERLLPPASIYVVDEAHGLEQTATAVFETLVTDYTVEQLLARTIFKEVVDEDRLDELRFRNTLAFQEVKLLSKENSFLIEGELEEIRKLATDLGELGKELRKKKPLGEATEDEDAKSLQRRIMLERTLELLSGTATALSEVASPRRDGLVIRYAQRVFERKRVTLELHAAPINPANLLGKFLFDPQDEGGPAGRMVICTSATLSTAGSFAHFRARCGVASPAVEEVLSPVFDYAQQALLYQPALPAYDHRSSDGYYVAAAAEIERLLQVSRGRALCLFTSWNGMLQVAQRLAPAEGARVVWPLRRQGDAPREALLAWFRTTPNSVLLATRSFWEGVDLPGDNLSLVVLDKLPFPSPGDPLTSARMHEVDATGSSFGDYMVPLMTLALKQGFGRLIRRTSDRGVVAILDERLTSKSYGRQVRRDLPPARFSRDLRDVHRFFQAALATDAEFALNLWAAPDTQPEAERETPVRWRGQVVRLLDGKASEADGVHVYRARQGGNGPTGAVGADAAAGAAPANTAAAEGELVALAAALADLLARVERGGRSARHFSVEVRCHTETAAQLAATDLADNELLAAARAAMAAWGATPLLPLANGDGLPADA